MGCDMTGWWIGVVTLSVLLGTTIWSFVKFGDEEEAQEVLRVGVRRTAPPKSSNRLGRD